MHIREDLVCDKNTGKKCLFITHHNLLHIGELIGFTSLGDISDQLQSVINSANDSAFPPKLLSNSMMTLMVKGLFNRLEFPYAYFPK